MKKFLICIDTSDDKKRTRLNKIMLRYGERVQYSVFEFLLNETDEFRLLQEMKNAVEFDESIQLNVYFLPEDARVKIERWGAQNEAPMAEQEIFVF